MAGLLQYVHELQLSLHVLVYLQTMVQTGDTGTSLQSLCSLQSLVRYSGADTNLQILQFLCSKSVVLSFCRGGNDCPCIQKTECEYDLCPETY